MFGNNYYGGNAWNNPYGIGAVPVQQQANSIMCVMVQSKEEVDNYLVAANTTVILMCFPLKKFFIKKTDANGIQVPMREFDWTEKTMPAPQQIQNSEIDEIKAEIKRISEAVAAMGGAKQNVSDEQ